MKTVTKKYIGAGVIVLLLAAVFTLWQIWSKKNTNPQFTIILPTQQPTVNGPAFISRANEITSFQNLTLNDFPSLQEDIGELFGKVWNYHNDYIFTFWNHKEIAIFDADMHLKSMNNTQLIDCDVQDSIQTGKYFFVLCPDQDKKIYMINLEKNTVEYIFNVPGSNKLAIQKNFLWTGDRNDAYRIDIKTKQVIKFPNIPADRMYASENEVWATDFFDRTISRFHPTNNTWSKFSIKDFPEPPSLPFVSSTDELDFNIDDFVISPTGTYVQYKFSSYSNKDSLLFSSSTVAKFNILNESWTSASSSVFTEEQKKITESHVYRSSVDQEKGGIVNGTAKIDSSGQRLDFPLHALKYFALTEPVESVRYLLSPVGIEKFSQADHWPVLVKPLKWEWLGMMHNVEIIISPDKKFLIILINYVAGGEGIEDIWTQISLYNLQTNELFSSARKAINDWDKQIGNNFSSHFQDKSKIIISSESAGSIAEVDLTKKSIRFLKK